MNAQEFTQPSEFFENILPVAGEMSEEPFAEGANEYPNESRNLLAKGKAAVKASIITVAFLPTNEAIRYGSLAATQTYSHNPVLGAAVLGGTTFLVEGASALAAADWVAKDRIKDVIDKLDDKLADKKILNKLSPKKLLPKKAEISPVTEAGIAMTFGTVALLEVRQRLDSERTTSQNRRRGLGTAAWMGSVFAVEGALIAEGVEGIDSSNSTTAGLALLGIAGLMAVRRRVKKRAEDKNSQEREG